MFEGAFQIFIHAAPLDAKTFRDFDFPVETPLCLGNEPAFVTTAHVGADRQTPSAVRSGNRRLAVHDADVRDMHEWNRHALSFFFYLIVGFCYDPYPSSSISDESLRGPCDTPVLRPNNFYPIVLLRVNLSAYCSRRRPSRRCPGQWGGLPGGSLDLYHTGAGEGGERPPGFLGAGITGVQDARLNGGHGVTALPLTLLRQWFSFGFGQEPDDDDAEEIHRTHGSTGVSERQC